MTTKRITILLTTVALASALANTSARAQCAAAPFAGGLAAPSKLIFSTKGNLLVAESGNGPNTGRISIVDPTSGERRTLVDGLPAGLAAEGGTSGPSGLAMRGRKLYVTIGAGDATLPAGPPGAEVPNPAPSSPILSSLLELRFSAGVERKTDGFTMTVADHDALANGDRVKLRDGRGGTLTVRLIADFPDFTPSPRPDLPDAVRPSNPFGVVADKKTLYVVDAAANAAYLVDARSKESSTFAVFAPVPNTRGFGPPVSEAVPDSIRLFGDRLLVTILTGFPFPPGAAQVRALDPATGESEPLITGLTTAIDVLPIETANGTEFLTLEFSAEMLASPPLNGRLRRYATPDGPPQVLADCLVSPTSMARDEKTGAIFITEIFTGRIVKIG